jgi:hypothetical protein
MNLGREEVVDMHGLHGQIVGQMIDVSFLLLASDGEIN